MAVTLGRKSDSCGGWTVRPQRGEQREWPRYALGAWAEVELRVNGRNFSCRMEDISLGGARLKANDLSPVAGSTIGLFHPASGHCTVASSWRRGNRLGVTFDFSPECLALIDHFVGQQLTGAPPALTAAG